MVLSGHADKLDREHDYRAWAMWHGAALTGVKKLPPLKEFLSSARKKPSQGVNEDDIINRLKLYKKKVGENGAGS